MTSKDQAKIKKNRASVSSSMRKRTRSRRARTRGVMRAGGAQTATPSSRGTATTPSARRTTTPNEDPTPNPPCMTILGEGTFGRVVQCGDVALKLPRRTLTEAQNAFITLLEEKPDLQKYFMMRSKEEFQYGMATSCGRGVTLRKFIRDPEIRLSLRSRCKSGSVCEFENYMFATLVDTLRNVLSEFHSANLAFCDLKLDNMMVCPDNTAPKDQQLVKFIDLDDIVLFKQVNCRVMTPAYGFWHLHPMQNDYIAFCCILLEALRYSLGQNGVWPELLPRDNKYVIFTALCLYRGLSIQETEEFENNMFWPYKSTVTHEEVMQAITLLERYTRKAKYEEASVNFMPHWLEEIHKSASEVLMVNTTRVERRNYSNYSNQRNSINAPDDRMKELHKQLKELVEQEAHLGLRGW